MPCDALAGSTQKAQPAAVSEPWGIAMRVFRSVTCFIAVLLGLAVVAAVTAAEKYPSRPIHWVVGFAAGGPNDTVARIFGEWLGNHLGQQFVVEDRTGQGGMIG